MATTSSSKTAPVESDEPATVPEVAPELVTSADDADKGMKAYRSDRNLAEVNAGVTVWMDPKSDYGKRLLATGYFTEVDDEQA